MVNRIEMLGNCDGGIKDKFQVRAAGLVRMPFTEIANRGKEYLCLAVGGVVTMS